LIDWLIDCEPLKEQRQRRKSFNKETTKTKLQTTTQSLIDWFNERNETNYLAVAWNLSK
jgi:hypothetical protein